MHTDKTIIITGACSDIGYALAKQLVDIYNLILIDMSKEKLLELKEKICSSSFCSNKIYLYDSDFSSINELGKNFYSFLKTHSITEIYGMVHVAGIAPVLPLKSTNVDDWYNILNINILAGIEIVRVLIKREYKKNLKSVIFISSVAAHFGVKAQIMYSVSKAAIEAFIRGAAVELSPIRFNAIAPGRVKTNSMAVFIDDTAEKFESRHLLGGGTADNIADILYFLLSEKSSWITGQTYIIDGGVSVNALN